jgi:Mrp family chromosome partitioning ATPase
VFSVLGPQTARWQRARRSAPAAFEKTTGLRHATTVPAETRLGGGPLVGAPSAPSTEFQDAFQKLASALFQGDQRVFTVSSARAGEGKTMITGNLGVALATGGRRVLLIDACEQRRPC